MKLNFYIQYTVYAADGVTVLRSGEMKAKGADNEMHAKVRLEQHLRKLVPGFGSMVVHSCRSTMNTILGEMGGLKDILDSMR